MQSSFKIDQTAMPPIKQQYKNLASGMSSIHSQQPENIMMDAIVIAKKQEDQKAQI